MTGEAKKRYIVKPHMDGSCAGYSKGWNIHDVYAHNIAASYWDNTHPDAKAAAQAECDRLNAADVELPQLPDRPWKDSSGYHFLEILNANGLTVLAKERRGEDDRRWNLMCAMLRHAVRCVNAADTAQKLAEAAISPVWKPGEFDKLAREYLKAMGDDNADD